MLPKLIDSSIKKFFWTTRRKLDLLENNIEPYFLYEWHINSNLQTTIEEFITHVLASFPDYERDHLSQWLDVTPNGIPQYCSLRKQYGSFYNRRQYHFRFFLIEDRNTILCHGHDEYAPFPRVISHLMAKTMTIDKVQEELRTLIHSYRVAKQRYRY